MGPSRKNSARIRVLIGTVTLLLLIGVFMFESSFSQATALGCDRGFSTAASPQLADGKFRNPTPQRDDMVDAARKWFRGAPYREPESLVPIIRPRTDQFTTAADELGVTWFGHSTVLLEIAGLRVLLDPVWSDRVSPIRGFGPKRFFDPPMAMNELPRVDVVVISHDHYDHLDHATIMDLAARGPRFVAPLGVGARLRDWGVDGALITELDWWGETIIEDLRLVCTPARHFSGRGLLDRNRTLWAGWALISDDKTIFFSGDSGFGPHFAEIGRRLGPFDLSLMEIGAYDSAWADVHMGPEQAVEAHRLVGGGLMLPIHWATFNLALHPWTEPGERVLAEAGRTKSRIVLPRPGERFHLDQPPEVRRWWPEVPWRTASEAPVVSTTVNAG
jgi:L-ascorbate metabolism protein UlaG (beta-lactamase superfamily)